MKNASTNNSGDKTAPRVLFLAGCWYPDDEQPYAGLFIERHAVSIAQQGVEVAVLHLAPSADHVGPLRVEKACRSGVDVFHVRYSPVGSAGLRGIANQVSAWKAGTLGSQTVRRNWGEPDLLHIHVVPSAAFVLAARRIFPRLPLLISEHWSGYLPESGQRFGLGRTTYTRWLTSKAACVTTVSENLARAMRARGFSGRYRIIRNVVDTTLFRPADTPPANLPYRLVHISFLKPLKNVVPTVELAARLVSEGVAIKLDVVGDGPEKERAIDLAAGKQVLDTAVRFHGALPDNQVAELLRRSHGLVLLSDYENSPCVISEAMACGLPVLATDVGGVAELVDETRGVLVPAGSWSAAEQGLRHMVGNTASFSRRSIRNYAVRHHSFETVGRQFVELYEEVVDNFVSN